MKELLCMRSVSQNAGPLRNFNLEVYSGEIVLLHGLAGSGLRTLLDIFKGKKAADRGLIRIGGVNAPLNRSDLTVWRNIFVSSGIRYFVPNLSVADNLAIQLRPHAAAAYYSRKNAAALAGYYLKQAQIDIDPNAPFGSLTPLEKLQLNILKAEAAKASLVVLDHTRTEYDAAGRETLDRMLCRLRGKGMSFLILTYQPMDEDVRIADRVLEISQGRDRFELRRNEFGYSARPGRMTGVKMPGNCCEGLIERYKFDMEISEYLTFLRDRNPAFWAEHMNFPVPQKGEVSSGGTVLIPRDSAALLCGNLTASDNLILPLRQRAASSCAGVISGEAVCSVCRGFEALTAVDPYGLPLRSLNYALRRILSIYRWELTRPKVMVIESPFYGLDSRESEQVREYLRHLHQQDIRIIYYSDSLPVLQSLCGAVTQTEHAEVCRRMIS